MCIPAYNSQATISNIVTGCSMPIARSKMFVKWSDSWMSHSSVDWTHNDKSEDKDDELEKTLHFDSAWRIESDRAPLNTPRSGPAEGQVTKTLPLILTFIWCFTRVISKVVKVLALTHVIDTFSFSLCKMLSLSHDMHCFDYLFYSCQIIIIIL